MRQKVKPSYPKGIEVVKNTDAKYDIYGKLNDYISPNFYIATNPDHYDIAGFYNIKNKTLIRRDGMAADRVTRKSRTMTVIAAGYQGLLSMVSPQSLR